MKKIVALGAIAALAGGMIFADEPAIDIKVAELSGNAEVKWGMDLDAGQHGFKNSSKAEVKVKLWGETTKSTEEDDIWAELKIKTTEADLKQNSSDGGNVALDGGTMSVEEATLHINDFFVRSVDCSDLFIFHCLLLLFGENENWAACIEQDSRPTPPAKKANKSFQESSLTNVCSFSIIGLLEFVKSFLEFFYNTWG